MAGMGKQVIGYSSKARRKGGHINREEKHTRVGQDVKVASRLGIGLQDSPHSTIDQLLLQSSLKILLTRQFCMVR